MLRLRDFLPVVFSGDCVVILKSRFRMVGPEEVLWTNEFVDFDSVPKDLLRRKVVRVSSFQNVLKIWVK